MPLILSEQRRTQLDGIVGKMQSESAPEEDIRFVVDDFKGKYGVDDSSNSIGGKLQGAVGGAMQGFFAQGVGGGVEGLGDLASLLGWHGDKNLTSTITGEDAPNALQQAGRDIKADAKETFPTNEVQQEQFGTKAGMAVGQAVEFGAEFVVTGGALKAAGSTFPRVASVVSKIGNTAKAAPIAEKLIEGGMAVSKAEATATVLNGYQTIRQTIGLGSALVKGADQGEDVARQYKVSGDYGKLAALTLGFGVVEALTERLGGFATEEVLGKYLRGEVTAHGIRAWLGHATTEGGEEVAAQIGQNALTRWTVPHDANDYARTGQKVPGYTEGSLEAGGLGFIAGGVISAPTLFNPNNPADMAGGADAARAAVSGTPPSSPAGAAAVSSAATDMAAAPPPDASLADIVKWTESNPISATPPASGPPVVNVEATDLSDPTVPLPTPAADHPWRKVYEHLASAKDDPEASPAQRESMMDDWDMLDQFFSGYVDQDFVIANRPGLALVTEPSPEYNDLLDDEPAPAADLATEEPAPLAETPAPAPTPTAATAPVPVTAATPAPEEKDAKLADLNAQLLEVEKRTDIDEETKKDLREPIIKAKLDIFAPKDSGIHKGQSVMDHLLAGGSISQTDKVSLADALTADEVDKGSTAIKTVEEVVESGLARAAHALVEESRRDGNTPVQTLDVLADLQSRVAPTTQRTADSKIRQAYSTPPTIGFFAGELADVANGTHVADLAGAGNGMLLIGAPDSARVEGIELDAGRFGRLSQTDFPNKAMFNGDAMTEIGTGEKVDRLLINPPFGSDTSKTEHPVNLGPVGDGTFSTSVRDYAFVAKALERLTDNGKAAIIIGAKGGVLQSPQGRADGYANSKFYKALYDNFNVAHHYTLAGDLYKSQGASFPVDVIVVDGRRPAGSLPLNAGKSMWDEKGSYPIFAVDGLPPVLKTLSDLRDVLAGKPAVAPVEQPAIVETPTQTTNEPASGTSSQPRSEDSGIPTSQPGDSRGGENPAAISQPGAADTNGEGVRGLDAGQSREESGSSVQPGDQGVVEQPATDTVVNAEPGRSGALGGRESSSVQPAQQHERPAPGLAAPSAQAEAGAAKQAVNAVKLGDQHIDFTPVSGVADHAAKMPANLATPVRLSMEKIQEEVGGDLVSYVRGKLGYNAYEDITKYFNGKQIDTLAAAIYNIENGQGFINADQTGMGKGRAAAGLMKYAIANGKTPIFFTENSGLYDDMMRDLVAIGGLEVNPLFTNNAGDKFKTWVDAGGRTWNPGDKKYRDGREQFAATGKLPAPFNAIFSNYSQLSASLKTAELNKKGKPRLGVGRVAQLFGLRNAGEGVVLDPNTSGYLANSIFVLDESHNAAGKIEADGTMQNGGLRLMKMMDAAGGVYYSSATWAKNPETMPLYGKTAISDVGMSGEEFADVMQQGGRPLQQWVTQALAANGQLHRRESDFAGVDYAPRVEEATPERVELADDYADSLRQIAVIADKLQALVRKASAIVRKHGSGMMGGLSKEATLEYTNFGSRMFNYMRQFIMALNSENAIAETRAQLAAGRKPIITFENTMASPIKRLREDGYPVNFTGLLLAALADATIVKVGRGAAKTEVDIRSWLSDPGVPSDIKAGVADVTRSINTLHDFIEHDLDIGNLPVSPIDHITRALTADGYTVLEATGRNDALDADGNPVALADDDTHNAIRAKWNGTPKTVLLTNTTTGWSGHASPSFADQSQRAMIVLQPNLDVNKFMQTLGRVNRTGQTSLPVYRPLYSFLPSENRLRIMHSKKLESLNATVAADKDSKVSSSEAPDAFNEVGDEVAFSTLRDMLRAKSSLPGLMAPRWSDEANIASDFGAVANDGDFISKVFSFAQLLPYDDQDSLLNTILANYTSRIQALNEAGANPLVVQPKDYQATAIDKPPVTVFSGAGSSTLSAPATLQQYTVQAGMPPATRADLESAVRDNRSKAMRALSDYLKANEAEMEAWEKDPKNVAMEKENPDRYEAKRNNRLAEMEARERRARHAVGQIGSQRYKGKDELNPESMSMITDVQFNTGGQLQTSSQHVVVAVNAGERKTISIPLTQIGNTDLVGSVSTSGTFWTDWENTADTSTERLIITGNLLGGFKWAQGRNARQIKFTMADGSIQDGIELYGKPENMTVNRRLSGMAELRATIEDGGQARFGEGVIFQRLPHSKVQADPNTFIVAVPSNKSGERYYGNPALSGLMDVQPFAEQNIAGQRLMVGRGSYSNMGKLFEAAEGLAGGINVSQALLESAREQSDVAGYPAAAGTASAARTAARYQMPNMNTSSTPGPGATGTPVGIPTIIKAMENTLASLGGNTVIRVRRFRQRASGIYNDRTDVARVDAWNNIYVAAHEVGHAVANHIFGGIATANLFPAMPQAVRSEMRAAGRAIYGTSPPGRAGYLGEGFAEFIRGLIVDPASSPGNMPHSTRWWSTYTAGMNNPAFDTTFGVLQRLVAAWQEQTPFDRATAQMAMKTWRDKLPSIPGWSSMMKGVVEEFEPLAQLVKDAEAILGRPVAIGDNPYEIASSIRGKAGAMTYSMILGEGVILPNGERAVDAAGNPIGNLVDILAPARGHEMELSVYMWARRAVDLWARPTPVDPGMSLTDANHLVAQLGTEFPQFIDIASRVHDWQDGVMEFYVQSNPAAADSVAAMRKENPFYVPLSREFTDGEVKAVAAAAARTSNPLKSIRGSGRRVKPIFESIVNNTFKLIAAGNKARVLQAVVNLANLDPNGIGKLVEELPRDRVPNKIDFEHVRGQLEDMGINTSSIPVPGTPTATGVAGTVDLTTFTTLVTPRPGDPTPIVAVRDAAGTMRWYQVSAELEKTLQGAEMENYKDSDNIAKRVAYWTLQFPAAVFRAGTTGVSTAFALVTNPTRDIQTFIMQSRTSSNPARLMAAYLAELTGVITSALGGNKTLAHEYFERLGIGGVQPLGMDVDYTASAVRGLFQSPVMRVVSSPIEALREVLSFTEKVPRLAEMRLALQNMGADETIPLSQAQFDELRLLGSRITTDFAAGSVGVKFWNRFVPFFNANIQGQRAFWRTARDRPGRTLLYGASLIAATLALWASNRDKEWYRRLPWREKQLYYNFEHPNGKDIIQVPRAQDYGVWFSAFPEMMMDAIYTKEMLHDPEGAGARVDAAWNHVWAQMMPEWKPVLANAAAEQIANRIQFFDRPIIPKNQINKVSAQHVAEYSSEFSKAIARAFPDGVMLYNAEVPVMSNDPRRIDAAVRQVFGTVGGQVLSASDWLIKASRSEGVAPSREYELSDMPVLGRLFRRGGAHSSANQAINDFYEARLQYKTLNTSGLLDAHGRQVHQSLDSAGDLIGALQEQIMRTPSQSARIELYKGMGDIAEQALALKHEGITAGENLEYEWDQATRQREGKTRQSRAEWDKRQASAEKAAATRKKNK